MLSILKRRIAGMRESLAVARRTADEMNQLYGNEVLEKLSELEASALERKAYREFLFWKLTKEYARETRKQK